MNATTTVARLFASIDIVDILVSATCRGMAVNDKGASNFDDLLIKVDGRSDRTVVAALESLGLRASKAPRGRGVFVSLRRGWPGQGRQRTTAVEAARDMLNRREGVSASVWYQID